MTEETDIQHPVVELHDDLKNYVVPGELIPQWLHHPLIIYIPYHENFNAEINVRYKLKLSELKRFEKECDWWGYLFVYERPYRLDAFMDICDRMEDEEFWKIAGWLWTDTENQWQNVSTWNYIKWQANEGEDYRPKSECFMDEDERKFLDSLPESGITIYRGCFVGINDFEGLSWTLDKEVAEQFANRGKREDDWESTILEKTIDKKDIFAVKLSRKEMEIILK